MKNDKTDKINQLFHLVIRVPKSDSAYTYFQLEANEGLCFYSTLDSSLGESFRDIDIRATLEYQSDVEHLIEKLRAKFPLEILLKNEVANE